MNNFEVIGVLQIKDTPRIGVGSATLFGHKVKLNTRKLKVFRYNGLNCKGCGLRATHWKVEKQLDRKGSSPTVLNLYGTREGGEEVMMTQDHIRPRAAGGGNSFENLQTMCFTCNSKKREFDEVDMAEYTYGQARKRMRDIVYRHSAEDPKHVLYSKIVGVLRDVYAYNNLPINRTEENAEADHEDPEGTSNSSG